MNLEASGDDLVVLKASPVNIYVYIIKYTQIYNMCV
jgi:hypothetical protein